MNSFDFDMLYSFTNTQKPNTNIQLFNFDAINIPYIPMTIQETKETQKLQEKPIETNASLIKKQKTLQLQEMRKKLNKLMLNPHDYNDALTKLQKPIKKQKLKELKEMRTTRYKLYKLLIEFELEIAKL